MRRTKLPKRPYRDSALLYGGFTIASIAILVATDGNLLVGVPLIAGCFVLATGYAWWQIRKRLDAEEESS
jgi:hypothetical protein